MIQTDTMTAAPLAIPATHPERRKLVTTSVAVDRADALDRLGLSDGSADAYFVSGEWVRLGRDRVRLVPMASGGPRASMAYALVETEHHNILVADDADPSTEAARAA